MLIGEWRAVLALVFAALSFWRKLWLEEQWMQERFGEDYRAYSGRVAALIPFVL
jgi:protein-S-isoprenylcysteine O-methyltransferase Ste14